ncbi:MAG: Hpt domain-containing protein [Leptonema sp. (in: Bacteria)]|nr:Hpt domain-containing protein [Leptonema sp. (in: bacteria)]
MSTNRIEVSKEIEDIMPIFINSIKKNVNSVKEALKLADFETIRKLGHQMKGAGGGYGFDRITELGRDLEMAAKASNQEECGRLNELIHTTIEDTEIVFVDRPL